MDEFYLCLSPKGSVAPNKWRTGFYHIAKRMDCYIVPIGFDYVKKKIIFKDGFKVGDMTFDEVSNRCKDEMADIHPLHPEMSEFPLNIDKSDDANFVSPWRLMIIILIIVIVVLFIIALWRYFR